MNVIKLMNAKRSVLYIIRPMFSAFRYMLLIIALPARAVTIENPLGSGTTISGTIARIVDFIFQLGLAIAVIVFLVGGFQYLFSFGSEQKVESAKNTLWYGVVGVVIMLVARSVTALIKNILGA